MAPARELELTDGFEEKRVRYRGTDYLLREIPIGQYEKIQKQSVVKEPNEEGEMIERYDRSLADRLLLSACLVEPDPRTIDITKLGTKIVMNLNGIVSKLMFIEEIDELTKPKSDLEDKGEAKGKRSAPAS